MGLKKDKEIKMEIKYLKGVMKVGERLAIKEKRIREVKISLITI